MKTEQDILSKREFLKADYDYAKSIDDRMAMLNIIPKINALNWVLEETDVLRCDTWS